MIEDAKLFAAAAEFVENFENVFQHDWDFTKDAIGDPYLIHGSQTFLNPGVDDESNNWFNRGSLLDSYRTLKAVLDR